MQLDRASTVFRHLYRQPPCRVALLIAFAAASGDVARPGATDAGGPAQSPPAVEYYRLVPGFVPEQFNADGMAMGTGFAAANPWGAYTAYLLATNGKGQRSWRIENYLPNAANGTAQGSSMYLFEGSALALLIDTAQNTTDEPGQPDLKGVVRHLLGHDNDGTPRLAPVDFVVANTHSHGDHTGKNRLMSDRTVYYPERDWPTRAPAPANYAPIREGGGPSPRGNGRAIGEIALGGRTIAAIDLHAHTPGSTGYLDRENRMIATGDAIGSAYVWAHFGTIAQYAHTVHHLQDVLRPLAHVDVLPAHFYQVKQGARGGPPINGRPLDKTYVDDQVRAADGILAGTVVSEPYRTVGRHALIATVDSAQVVWTMGNLASADWPLDPQYADSFRAATLPGTLPAAAGDRFAGVRNIRSRLYLIRGASDDTAYLLIGSTRALLIGTGTGTAGLPAFARQLAGSTPLDVVVTSDDPAQVGGLAHVAGHVMYLPAGITAPADATQVKRIGPGDRIALGLDEAGRPLALEVHPLGGHSRAGVTLLSVSDRALFAGDALGTQGPDAGLVIREPLSVFASALRTWRLGTDGRYDVVFTAHNFQWFTSPDYVDQVAQAVNKGMNDAAAFIESATRPGVKAARSDGAADVVASIVVEEQ